MFKIFPVFLFSFRVPLVLNGTVTAGFHSELTCRIMYTAVKISKYHIE